jgi:transcriptional regulator with XRE-family HTH domain
VSSVQLSREVRAQREALQLSLRDVAEASGLALGYVHRVERGQVRDPSPHALRALARALRVPYTQLMRAAGYLP